MINLILKGGLGNQMFQYAFGKNLALQKNEQLSIDLAFLDCRIPVKGFTVRNYELDLFGIPEAPKKSSNFSVYSKYFSYPIAKIGSKFNSNYITDGVDIYAYDRFLVEKAMNASGDLVVEGSWNNPKYFAESEKAIRAIFDMQKLYDEKYKTLEGEITSSNSVSINIRRGDYINAKHKDVYVYLDKDYYTKAIDIIRSKVVSPKFFVFSYDDLEWLQSQLNFAPGELVVVGRESVGDRFKTYLRLIALCKHNIISNSTFAFWGAYLNSNPEKICISPKQWTYGHNFDAPTNWNLI